MRVIVPVLIVLVFVLSGVVYADQPVPAVPETQGLVTTTTADVVGMATETDVGAWALTNSPGTVYLMNSAGATHTLGLPPGGESGPALIAGGGSYTLGTTEWGTDQVLTMAIPESMLNQVVPGYEPHTWLTVRDMLRANGYSQTISGGLHTGVLDPGEVRYTTAYDANIVAQAGHTVLSKSMNINTGNKVLTQSNLDAKTLLTFVAIDDGGSVVGSENLMLDGAGSVTTASDRMLCPFAATPIDQIPAYCNIVQIGNAYDLTVGSITSDMSERFVGTDATIPVQLDHAFNVKPYGTTDGSIPAIGSASAYFKAHIQEARVNGTQKAEDLQYSETSSASGVIQQFTKEIHYQSGRLLLP